MLFLSMIKSSSKLLFRISNFFASDQPGIWESPATFGQIIGLQKSEFTHHVLWKNNICSCNPMLYQNAGKMKLPRQ